MGKRVLFAALLRPRQAAWLALAIAILGVALSAFPALVKREQSIDLYTLFRLRGAVPAPQDVVVVAMNRDAATQLGVAKNVDRWPRRLHAQLIDALSGRGVRVIAFDLAFQERREIEEIQQLAQAMQRAGNVVLAVRVDAQPLGLGGDVLGAQIVQEPNLPELDAAAAATAPFLPPDLVPGQERLDSYHAFHEGFGDIPELPVAAFHIYAAASYDALLRALHTTDPNLARRLPASSSRQSLGWLRFISEIERRLRNDPALVEQLNGAITAAAKRSQLSAQEARLARSMIELHSSDAQRFFNFYGPLGSVRTVRFDEAISGQGSGAIDWRGKAVVVGFSEPRQIDQVRDHYMTVFTTERGVDLSGAELGATVLGNLIEASSIRSLRPWHNLLLVLAWAALVGTLCCLPFAWSLPALGLLAVGYALMSFGLFTSKQLLLPLLVPLAIQLPIALASTLTLKYRETRRLLTRVQQTLGAYLQPELLRGVVNDLTKLEPQHRLVYATCMVTDVEGYTSIAEEMDPAQLHDLMNAYFETVIGVVHQHQGAVRDLRGDGMLALWVSATPSVESRARACRAAIEVVRRSEEFSRQPQRPAMRPRIGLSTGQISLGPVGGAGYGEVRAVGDIVNLAARLQEQNKQFGTQILADALVTQGTAEFSLHQLASIQPRGRKSSLDLVEILPVSS